MHLALFENIGGLELAFIVFMALLVFGRRLPEVAHQAGQQWSKLRHSLDSARRDSGVDEELRKIKSVMPTNMSPRELARLAARKMEERLSVGDELVASEVRDAAPYAVADESLHPEGSVARGGSIRAGVDPASAFGAATGARAAISPSELDARLREGEDDLRAAHAGDPARARRHDALDAASNTAPRREQPDDRSSPPPMRRSDLGFGAGLDDAPRGR